jgi:hypothetical protein
VLVAAASLLAAMDRAANPCTDFFQFACGTWNKKHVIPEDRSSISTFEVLADQLQVILKGNRHILKWNNGCLRGFVSMLTLVTTNSTENSLRYTLRRSLPPPHT